MTNYNLTTQSLFLSGLLGLTSLSGCAGNEPIPVSPSPPPTAVDAVDKVVLGPFTLYDSNRSGFFLDRSHYSDSSGAIIDGDRLVYREGTSSEQVIVDNGNILHDLTIQDRDEASDALLGICKALGWARCYEEGNLLRTPIYGRKFSSLKEDSKELPAKEARLRLEDEAKKAGMAAEAEKALKAEQTQVLKGFQGWMAEAEAGLQKLPDNFLFSDREATFTQLSAQAEEIGLKTEVSLENPKVRDLFTKLAQKAVTFHTQRAQKAAQTGIYSFSVNSEGALRALRLLVRLGVEKEEKLKQAEASFEKLEKQAEATSDRIYKQERSRDRQAEIARLTKGMNAALREARECFDKPDCTKAALREADEWRRELRAVQENKE